jgi:hypothetical protein
MKPIEWVFVGLFKWLLWSRIYIKIDEILDREEYNGK